MNVPLNTQAGETDPLTCPDGKTYYQHLSQTTSAQYYINQPGTAVNEACAWGTDQTGSGIAQGNWAPANLGVGQDADGNKFISMLSTEQNYPDKVIPLTYNIELQGDFGGSACMYVYRNGVGQFCTGGTLASPTGCQTQGQYVAKEGPVPGCTVGYPSYLTFRILTILRCKSFLAMRLMSYLRHRNQPESNTSMNCVYLALP